VRGGGKLGRVEEKKEGKRGRKREREGGISVGLWAIRGTVGKRVEIKTEGPQVGQE